MASHEPFRHLEHKLWSKEGSVVKLAVRLPTIKKLGIDPTPVCASGVRYIVENLLRRATSLLQTSSQSEVWAGSYELPKSRESKSGQFRDSSLGVPGQKAIQMWGAAEQRREYYMGEGGGFPWVQAVVSQVSPCCPWLVPTSRVFSKVN